jgi:hypothetical protein
MARSPVRARRIEMDERSGALDAEVREMLQTFEGPARPVRTPWRLLARRRKRRLALAAAIGVGLVAVVATAAVIGLHDGKSRQAPTQAGGCPQLRFDGALYVGTGSRAELNLGLDGPLGTGLLPGCPDSAAAVGQSTTPTPEPESYSIPISRIHDVDPSVAVGSPRFEGIYVLAGRCYGYVANSAFTSCLREQLRFDGRPYVATRPPIDLPVGAAVGSGVLGRRRLSVRRLEHVSPQIAVALEGIRGTIYVASGACLVDPLPKTFPQTFAQCLARTRG